ncbi:hypothetical protein C8R43DRAFT_1028776 [Mycena crocata]|nr:hypothetical protein C8R43DRAFT_1028776 [Mycena crocata]
MTPIKLVVIKAYLATIGSSTYVIQLQVLLSEGVFFLTVSYAPTWTIPESKFTVLASFCALSVGAVSFIVAHSISTSFRTVFKSISVYYSLHAIYTPYWLPHHGMPQNQWGQFIPVEKGIRRLAAYPIGYSII